MKLPLLSKNRTLLVCAALLALVVLLVFVAFSKPLDVRLHPFPYPEQFDFQTGTFPDYITFAQHKLGAGRVDNPAADVIDKLSPFRLEPAQTCPKSSSGKLLNGIVLTHDLLDSPYVMLELGKYFQSRCFLVLGLLLPGHGTRPGDLLNTHWQQWAAAESFAARAVASETENVFLGGHGSGGTLSMLEAANNAEIDGLLLFAPALTADAAPWYAWLPATLCKVLPAAAWSRILPDTAMYRYESIPLQLQREADALTQAMLKAQSNRLSEIPVFTVASMEDSTVSTAAILEYMSQRTHPMSQTLLYSKHDIVAPPENVSVFPTWYPEQTVLSLAHTGLVTPIYDPQFGWDGAYRDCAHYRSIDVALYDKCRNGEREVYGETTEENLAQGLLERIGFNPFYLDMFSSIDAFLSPVITTIPTQEKH